MLKANVEWLEVRLGLRVTKRLIDKNNPQSIIIIIIFSFDARV